MDSISLVPLIELFEEHYYSISEDNENFVLMEKRNPENNDLIDKVMIPKKESDPDEYVSIINLKIQRLMNLEDDSNGKEQLIFIKNLLTLSSSSKDDKFSFRILDSNNIALDKIKKIIDKFSNLAQRYGELVGDPSYLNNIKFLPTTKGSFVVNVALPQEAPGLWEGLSKNETFAGIVKGVSDNEYDFITGNNQRNNEMKNFVTGLKDFSDEILGQTEIYYTTNKSLNKIAKTISNDEKHQITESLKQIESTILNPYELGEHTFSVLGTINAIYNRIPKATFITTLDGVGQAEFQRSGISPEDLQYIKIRDGENQDIILRNIKYIKLRTYYRIISAEIAR